jgi:magnesium chelatase subunit D
MKHHRLPFSAIVGQDAMKLCLMLAAVDWRLSVLLRGEKGSGKSTAARALAHILPGNAPFVNVPIGVTEDRLLGSLDLKAAFESNHQLKHGLIDEAHGGVLYIDEVNLLAGHLADALLDVSATGYYVLERDGFSHARPCHFTLLGSMNLEEGQLRPQLLDRFALAVDVCASLEAELRAEILSRCLRFNDDPDAFSAAYALEDQILQAQIDEARKRLPLVMVSTETLQRIAARVAEAGVQSLRADLAAVRASRALAALNHRTAISTEDVETVMPFVLLHRAKLPRPHTPPPVPAPPQRSNSNSEAVKENDSSAAPQSERVFDTQPVMAPKLTTQLPSGSQRGRAHTEANGNSRPSPHAAHSAAIDIVRSLTEAARQTGRVCLREDSLVFRRAHQTSSIRYILLVDASGSQAARSRMSIVKGAASALLSSASNEDEVAVVAYRGAAAQVLLPPCRSAEEARRRLEFLPTGGRTPLAHGLALARELATPSTVLILLTDGQANVPLDGADPWEDALAQARRFTCPVLVVDNAENQRQQERVEALCRALRATRLPLDMLQSTNLISVARQGNAS